jgi:hypothetical protein
VVAWRDELLAAVLPLRRVDAELARSGVEDQPAGGVALGRGLAAADEASVTKGRPRTSLKKARVAVASSL